MQRIVLLRLLLGWQICSANNIALDNIIQKIVANNGLETLVSISNSDESILNSKQIPSIIFTANNTNVILAEHFRKSLLMLIYFQDNPEILQEASQLMLDNLAGGAKILLITDHFNIPFNMMHFGQLGIGLFSTSTNEFYSLDISRFPYFPWIHNDSGEYNQIEIPKNYTINVRVPTEAYVNKFKNCKWELCRFVHIFCEKFNLKLNVFTESTLYPVTIDFQNESDKNPNFKKVNFFEYHSLNVALPNLKKVADRRFYFLVPFSNQVWLIFGVAILLLVLVVSLESKLRCGSFSFATNSFIVFQIILAIKLPPNTVPPKFRHFKGLILLFFVVMITLYSCSLGNFLKRSKYETKFEILCSSKFAERLENRNDIGIEFKILPQSLYFDKMLSMDMKNGYCISQDIWDKFQHIQQRFEVKLFRLISKWTNDGTSFAFFMRRNSVIRTKFSELFSEAYTLGLIKKWSYEEIEKLSKINMKSAESYNLFSPLNLSDMGLPFQILVAGFMLGAASFVTENQYLRICFTRFFKLFKRLKP